MNVIVNGLMTNYHRAGHGKQLVLLHGWADSAKTYARLSEILKADYEVLMLDLPGFGGSQAPPQAWGLEQYADFVEAWLKKLNLKPYAMIGHSYGGAVAIIYASQAPQISKLILLASAGLRDKNRGRKMIYKLAAKTAKLPLYVLPEPKRRRVKQKLYGSIGSDLMLLPHMEQTYRKMINQDVRAAAGRINLPVLLIYGADDKLTPPSDGRLISQAIKHSQLEIVSGAGHFLHQEQVAEVGSLMADFLKGGRR